MLGLNWDTLQQILRYALQIIGSILIKDNAEAGQYWEAVSASLINIAGAVWWWHANRKAAVVAKVAALPEVKTITVTDAKLADTVTDPAVKLAA